MPGGAGDDLHAGLRTSDMGSVNAPGRVRRRSSSHDEAAVHLGVVHVEPLAAEPDPGLEVGRGVEAVGEHAVHARRLGDGRLAGVDLVDPAGLQAHQQPLEGLVVLGRDRDPGAAGVVRLVPDVEGVDDVVAAVLPDVVEDPRQDAAVHQVAGDLDCLAGTHATDHTSSSTL